MIEKSLGDSPLKIRSEVFSGNYSTVSMDATIFILAIERRGTAVANRQAAIEITAASKTAR